MTVYRIFLVERLVYINMKIIIIDSDKRLEISFDHEKKIDFLKFNPTTDNPIKIKIDDDEDKYWYFMNEGDTNS